MTNEDAVNKSVDTVIAEVAGLLSDLCHARQHGWFEKYPSEKYQQNFEQVDRQAENVVRALENYEVHMRQLRHLYYKRDN